MALMVDYEIRRQIEMCESGYTIKMPETRMYNIPMKKTEFTRFKDSNVDYWYFASLAKSMS